MLAEPIDAGLLRTAAERKNDQQILVQIQGKDSTVTKFATAIMQYFSPERRRSNESISVLYEKK
jgi:hypothetical protein